MTGAAPAPGGPPLSDEALLDPSVLEEMRTAVRPGEFAQIIEVFLEDTRARLARAKQDLEAGRLDRLADECHDLASTLGTFGAAVPMALARELMQAARAGDRAKVDRLGPGLLDAARRMTAMLESRYMPGRGAGPG